jgi:hypothetical protein
VGDLGKSVTRSLADAIGVRLRRVVIRAFDGEIGDRDRFANPQLYIGGEVRLDFESQSVFVSWAENDGWPDHFSIGVRSKSLFIQDSTLVDWDVGDLEPWSECTGQRLLAARVFAIDETPHVVEFSFDGQSFWMADGREQAVGDGDDLLIRPGSFPGFDGARLVWPV